ncbi:zinc metalloprotease [Aquimarina sp. MMG016]|uniref:zinc metalloprotease n=1 Tax=Aquimarina sp. MMG016 TaxID=2822690 RepID=UPI001B3A3756|nr:zinc metalloprotease [Aquimarina sp. MMG016]MBQ4820004.1 zinc metalloprotease [Aquimarina sp. MMG016]
MKKLTIPALVISLLFFLSCPASKDTDSPICMDTEKSKTLYKLTKIDSIKRCGTMEVLEKHMARTPTLKSRMDTIEKQCQAFIELRKTGKITDLDTITIPTIVHVIYNKDQENICDDQIISQIKVLNQDFSKTNPDINQIPEEFAGLSKNTRIRFELDSIIRKSSTRTEWGTDDQMKFSSNGGSDVIDSSTKLNIWVCNIGGGILGYAQFPGDDPATDGIVISPQFFGTKGFISPPFDKGRTTTHEVGHWLNLRHIWGDGNCSFDDFVDDTPLSDGPNFGCPQYPTVRCNSNDMTMNYMDYAEDACMYMFTEGQKDRMRAVFAPDGPRVGFVEASINL